MYAQLGIIIQEKSNSRLIEELLRDIQRSW